MKEKVKLPTKLTPEVCKECGKEYPGRKNSLYCFDCVATVTRRQRAAYQKKQQMKKRLHDPSNPIDRSVIARMGGNARAGKYMEGMSSIAYEPPPVVCPECGSYKTAQAYGTRYDCLECLYSFDYQEGL